MLFLPKRYANVIYGNQYTNINNNNNFNVKTYGRVIVCISSVLTYPSTHASVIRIFG